MFYVFKINKRRIFIIFLVFIAFLSILNFLLFVRYPVKYYGIIEKYSNIYNVDPILVTSMINVESNFKKDAISPKDARGLMQIRRMTADWAANEIGIVDYDYSKICEPDINIMIGTWYISKLLNQYNNDINIALVAYNAGSGNVSKWLKNYKYSLDGENLHKIPFKESERYINKIKRNMKIYKFMSWRMK